MFVCQACKRKYYRVDGLWHREGMAVHKTWK